MSETEQKIQAFKQNLLFFNGYLSSDPEIQYFESGKNKTTFSLPLKHTKEDEPVWLNCECWGSRGEEIAEKFKKGDEITVAGTLKNVEYKGKTYTNLVVKMWG